MLFYERRNPNPNSDNANTSTLLQDTLNQMNNNQTPSCSGQNVSSISSSLTLSSQQQEEATNVITNIIAEEHTCNNSVISNANVSATALATPIEIDTITEISSLPNETDAINKNSDSSLILNNASNSLTNSSNNYNNCDIDVKSNVINSPSSSLSSSNLLSPSTSTSATMMNNNNNISSSILSKELEDWIWQDNRHFLQDKNIFEHTYFR